MDQRSRYRNAVPFLAIDNRRGIDVATQRSPTLTYGVLPTFAPPRYPRGFRDHLWVQGDRIDYIAHIYLGDPHKWHRIMQLNPHLPDPHSIEPGTLIRIPNKGR